jgi:hypothetical protein
MTVQNSESIANGVLENGLDSIRHALDHFSVRNRDNDRSQHNDKWIVLSVHHAAECICNALLLQIEPNCDLFENGEKTWFPSLSKTLQRLEVEQNREHLTNAEQRLVSLLRQLPDIRHQFMHRVAPETVDVSIAAMCMIGLLKYLEARYGTEASDVVWQSPPIEGDVVAAIRYQRLDEYGRFVELFLREKYPNRRLWQCPSCSIQAVVSSYCEACFEELGSVTCSKCDEEVYFLPWERSIGRMEIDCQDCGATLDIS